jgi:hypothetical protein
MHGFGQKPHALATYGIRRSARLAGDLPPPKNEDNPRALEITRDFPQA